MDELEQLKRDNEVLYRDNVSLSETADRLREALAADDQASHIIEWKSRAEAAEAERDALLRPGEWVAAQLKSSGGVTLAMQIIDKQNAEIDRLQAEVARLTQRSHQEVDACCSGQKAELNRRIAELEQSIGLLSTLAPTMEIDPSNPMSMARTIETVVRTRTAELEAGLRELYATVRGECPSLLNEDSGGNAGLDMRIAALLGEGK